MKENSLPDHLVHHFKLTPPRAIMIGFGTMILIGALLLNLPIATASGESIGFLDALFTATSANCVTGLVVVNTFDYWSIFGKIVILLLIECGALGFITILTLLMILVRKEISLRNRLVIQASFNQNNMRGMVRLVKKVVIITLSFQAVGAVLLAFAFYHSADMTVPEAIFNGVFHAISSFCNAGFDNIGPQSLMPFVTNPAINFIIIALVISGGLGFTVWIELFEKLKNRKRQSLRIRINHLSLHTKIVLSVTVALLISGTILFMLCEWNNPGTLGDLSAPEKVQASLFQSVTVRTVGFFSIDQSALSDISKFISSLLMLIGGSPVSTAGGIKTVTIGVIFFTMLSVIRGRNRIEAFGRTIPFEIMQKALMVVSAFILLVLVATTILHFTEANNPISNNFIDLFYEVCSATGTVGLTTGLTPALSPIGKIVIILCMYFGRLSPITIAVALSMKLHGNIDGTSLPEEKVIIG